MACSVSHACATGRLGSGAASSVSGAVRGRGWTGSRTAVRRLRGALSLRVQATAEPKVKVSGGTEYKRPVRSKEKKDIYLGKGRVIKDDPKKYPDRDGLGVGGWAGGEVGLWSFRDEVKSAPPAKEAQSSGLDITKLTGLLAPKDGSEVKSFTAKVNGMQVDGEVRGAGDDLIYIGKGKGDKPAPGKPGKFIKDNARKYPDKEDLGILYGATGGFAGGEQGLKQFVEKGELDLLPPGASSNRAVSPLEVLFGVAGVAGIAVAINSFGGAGITAGGDVTGLSAPGGAVNPLAAVKSVDANTSMLLQAGLIVLGSAGAVAGGRAAIVGARKKFAETTKDGLVYALYFGGLILALKAVLEI